MKSKSSYVKPEIKEYGTIKSITEGPPASSNKDNYNAS